MATGRGSKRRETLRGSINAGKKNRQRVAEKGGEREQVRLQKQAMRQDLHHHAETEDAREARLQADRANKESKREADTEDARKLRLQDQAHRQDLRQTETEDKCSDIAFAGTSTMSMSYMGSIDTQVGLGYQLTKT